MPLPRLSSASVRPVALSASRTVAARFKPAGKINTPVREASDVVALPNGRLLVAGDTSGKLAVVSPDGKVKKLELEKLGRGPSQFEGLAYDPIRHHLFVAREESRELLRYEWHAGGDAAPKLEKRFSYDELKGPDNKGLEGLAYLPQEVSATGKAQLLGVKEGKPRELLMFGDGGGGGKPRRITLEPQVLSVCKDFSAVSIDPKTGHIFISSDESSTVAQVSLSTSRQGELQGRLVQSFPIRDENNGPLKRIEGITFNADGDLFVLTENNGTLRRFARVN